jgi:hypothetical protein
MEPHDLLAKHNPLLVLLPQDVTRHRPWSRWYKRIPWLRGDYHPCRAEFFLSFVKQRRRKRFWNPLSMIGEVLPEPTGLGALREMVENARPGDIANWELDLAPIKSQDPDQAWAAYGVMLQAEADRQGSVAYAHYVPGARPVLEYWYLYVYNDAPNKHEGDWEMVAIELGEDEQPLRAGYSGHASGFVRPWATVEKQGDRPVVYVARGSHAAYFSHNPKGHRTNSLPVRKGLPETVESAVNSFTKAFQDAAYFLRLQDRTAAKTLGLPSSPDAGQLVDPEVVVLPSRDDLGQNPDFWWMRLDCAWGSSHLRLTGSAAPDPPWGQALKWQTPASWFEGLAESR